MKKCPHCQGLESYDDSEMICPYCGAELAPYIRPAAKTQKQEDVQVFIRPARADTDGHPADPAFERPAGIGLEYRGIVVSITPSSRFMANPVKWFNSVFRGIPFQIGNPVHETVVRIEEICGTRIPEHMRNLIFYGEAAELDVGDDVTVNAQEKGGQYVIKSLYINDTDSFVRARGLIPAAAVVLLTAAALALLMISISLICSFFTSGGIWRTLNALAGGALSIASRLLITFAPLLLFCFMFRMIFRRR